VKYHKVLLSLSFAVALGYALYPVLAAPQDRRTDVSSTAEAKAATADVRVTGNPDMWQLLAKAGSQSEGWMRSTKALQVGPHVILQVSERQKNPDGSYTIDNDLIRVENLTIVPDVNGGHKLVPARVAD
jgi:hypothetical protein